MASLNTPTPAQQRSALRWGPEPFLQGHLDLADEIIAPAIVWQAWNRNELIQQTGASIGAPREMQP
jgi:hypothetical protein